MKKSIYAIIWLFYQVHISRLPTQCCLLLTNQKLLLKHLSSGNICEREYNTTLDRETYFGYLLEMWLEFNYLIEFLCRKFFFNLKDAKFHPIFFASIVFSVKRVLLDILAKSC